MRCLLPPVYSTCQKRWYIAAGGYRATNIRMRVVMGHFLLSLTALKASEVLSALTSGGGHIHRSSEGKCCESGRGTPSDPACDP